MITKDYDEKVRLAFEDAEKALRTALTQPANPTNRISGAMNISGSRVDREFVRKLRREIQAIADDFYNFSPEIDDLGVFDLAQPVYRASSGEWQEPLDF